MGVEFITNEKKILSDVINNILPSTENWDVLVGYFYFSGFKEVYEAVSDKHVRILVGMDVDVDPGNRIREYVTTGGDGLSRSEKRDYYYKGLVKIINDTAAFEGKDTLESWKLFLKKIFDGTLEIRKTDKPTHAKLYIFENDKGHAQGGDFPGTIITGSSNLTYSGLRKNYELNIVSRDKGDYEASVKIFQDLWKDAIVVADKNTLDLFTKNVADKVWLEKVPSPYYLYLKMLDEYFTKYREEEISLPQSITDGKFLNLKYQEDAIKLSLNIIKKHNGVIIADVVGLGKSIIASAVAHNLNLKTIIIAPPHLREQWEDYHTDFDFNAKIYSSGKILDALVEMSDDREKLIIIDEAHKYRNEFTDDYADLHKLCQKNKVILLTATPFNNKPQDVFSMIGLFQLKARSTIQTVENLSFAFQSLTKRYNDIKKEQKKTNVSRESIEAEIKSIAESLRNLMSPVVIRRSRLDLEAIDDYKKDLKQQKIEFPKVNPPEILEYDLGGISGLYSETLKMISDEFEGARYKPATYLKDFEKYKKGVAADLGIDENLLKQGQANLADFMKRLLVRRFESSIRAFRKTVDSMINSTKTVLDWYTKIGKVPIYKKGNIPDIDSIIGDTGDDEFEEVKKHTIDQAIERLEQKDFVFVDKKELRVEFEREVRKDLELLKQIKNKWSEENIKEDPKVDGFIKVVNKSLKDNKKRKIVVFTEFNDTADYLFEKLEGKLRVFKYSSADASKNNKEIIKKNFDAGYKAALQSDDYDVLVATDAISEGFNLHRAGIVFNYDIPFNPTRVIQRIGRINRINKKVFDELFIFNFFPTAKGEKEVHIKKIATLKINMIHALFGEDAKVLTNDEELQSFFKKVYEEEIAGQETLSPETKYENFIRNLKTQKPELVDVIREIPKRARVKRSEKKSKSGVVVFGKKGSEFVFKFAKDEASETQILPFIEAANLFEANEDEPGDKVSPSFYATYEKVMESLFTKRTEVELDPGKRKSLEVVRALKSKFEAEKEYLEELEFIIEKLDSLPGQYMRNIRSLSGSKDLKKGLEELKKIITPEYLSNIRSREKSIDEGKETLILSEELK